MSINLVAKGGYLVAVTDLRFHLRFPLPFPLRFPLPFPLRFPLRPVRRLQQAVEDLQGPFFSSRGAAESKMF